MAVIVYSGGITPSRLADLEQVKRPTITKVINGLEARGLVKRRLNPGDRRSSILLATDKGHEVWQAGQLRRIVPLVDRINSLSENERRQFEEAMDVLAKVTEPPQDS